MVTGKTPTKSWVEGRVELVTGKFPIISRIFQ